MAQDSGAAASPAGPRPADAAGVRLFAASARNILPRLVSSLAIAAVATFVFGLGWAMVWFGLTWMVVLAGIGLMGRIRARAAEGRPTGALEWTLLANNVVSGALSAGMAAAMWIAGDPLTGLFAVATLFIGAAYVLQHYYADPRAFYALISPYAAATTALVAAVAPTAPGGLARLVVIAALAISLVNFFLLSRRMLDRSRQALRQANRQARANEQKAAAANAAKSAFLARMSHEIRTPLNGIMGMTQAMRAGRLAAAQRRRLAVLEESGAALLKVVNDVLDLSKIEAGKLELEAIAFDFTPLVAGLAEAFAPLARQRDLTLEVEAAAARGRWLGDPARLRQILANLLGNALKFTEEGVIRIAARREGGGLVVAVADSGPGIAPEALPRLFHTFSQIDASTSRLHGGSGLGLAICQELAALMGGRIGVESALGAGSTFTLTAPLEYLGEETGAERARAEVAEAEAPLPSARLLVAEDNAVNQLVLTTLLEPMGLTPAVVGDGAAALAAWEANDFDIILMDIEMPLMDGVAAAGAIREAERRTGRPRTPIVALTANAMTHQIDAYLAAGMDDFIAKPIDAGQLFAVLRRLLAPAEPAALARLA